MGGQQTVDQTVVAGAGWNHRVLRGGSWNNNPNNVRAANRNRNNPNNRNNNVSVRVVAHGFPTLSHFFAKWGGSPEFCAGYGLRSAD